MKHNPAALPLHIGLIMDGNGRWAKKRGLPRTAGHKAGGDTFRVIVRYCNQIGLKYLTLYAFSTENQTRPINEVETLMRLFKDHLEEALRDFTKENIRVRFWGDRSYFNAATQSLMEENERLSAVSTGLTLNLAMNYGGRAEIVRSVKEIACDVAAGRLSPEAITESTIAGHLYTFDTPDPDLIIRPSGEFRTSNFLLWQSAYSELLFMNVLWPDFKPEHVDWAIDEYHKRNRRFGGV